jgi:hypothetical protein
MQIHIGRQNDYIPGKMRFLVSYGVTPQAPQYNDLRLSRQTSLHVC